MCQEKLQRDEFDAFYHSTDFASLNPNWKQHLGVDPTVYNDYEQAWNALFYDDDNAADSDIFASKHKMGMYYFCIIFV